MKRGLERQRSRSCSGLRPFSEYRSVTFSQNMTTKLNYCLRFTACQESSESAFLGQSMRTPDRPQEFLFSGAMGTEHASTPTACMDEVP